MALQQRRPRDADRHRHAGEHVQRVHRAGKEHGLQDGTSSSPSRTRTSRRPTLARPRSRWSQDADARRRTAAEGRCSRPSAVQAQTDAQPPSTRRSLEQMRAQMQAQVDMNRERSQAEQDTLKAQQDRRSCSSSKAQYKDQRTSARWTCSSKRRSSRRLRRSSRATSRARRRLRRRKTATPRSAGKRRADWRGAAVTDDSSAESTTATAPSEMLENEEFQRLRRIEQELTQAWKASPQRDAEGRERACSCP
jgi:hypothetical protein